MNTRRFVSVSVWFIAIFGLLVGAAQISTAKPKGGGGGGSALKIARKLKGHTNTINSVAFAKDGTTLGSGGLDFTIRLWDATKEKATKVIPLPEGTILHQLAFHPLRNQIAAGTSEGVLVFDTDGKQRHKLTIGKAAMEGAAYGPDGDSIAGVSADGVQTWTSDEGAKVKVNTKITNGKSVAFRPVVPGLVAVGREGEIVLWYPSDGQTKTLKTEGEIISVAFSPDGKFLASFGTDRVVRCFDVDQRKQVWEKGDVANDTRVAFAAEGKLVISGGDGDLVRAFGADDGADAWQAKAPTPNTRVVAASKNPKLLASAGETEVLIWTAK